MFIFLCFLKDFYFTCYMSVLPERVYMDHGYAVLWGPEESIISPEMVVTVVVSHHVLGASIKPAGVLSH